MTVTLAVELLEGLLEAGRQNRRAARTRCPRRPEENLNVKVN